MNEHSKKKYKNKQKENGFKQLGDSLSPISEEKDLEQFQKENSNLKKSSIPGTEGEVRTTNDYREGKRRE